MDILVCFWRSLQSIPWSCQSGCFLTIQSYKMWPFLLLAYVSNSWLNKNSCVNSTVGYFRSLFSVFSSSVTPWPEGAPTGIQLSSSTCSSNFVVVGGSAQLIRDLSCTAQRCRRIQPISVSSADGGSINLLLRSINVISSTFDWNIWSLWNGLSNRSAKKKKSLIWKC